LASLALRRHRCVAQHGEHREVLGPHEVLGRLPLLGERVLSRSPSQQQLGHPVVAIGGGGVQWCPTVLVLQWQW
jgi:hypothetical protein